MQLELVDSMPAIGRDGALSRRRIVASAECAHEPLQCSLRTHFHGGAVRVRHYVVGGGVGGRGGVRMWFAFTAAAETVVGSRGSGVVTARSA